jgi:3-hydroxyacyl-CoA dehydrogenase
VKVAIAGAGSIGVAWAIVFARAGHEVALYEPDDARRSEVTARLGVPVHDSLEDAVAGAELVLECAPEDLAVKRALFSRLAELTEAPLASSSSALTASQFAPGIARALVAHPANPPHILRIVELVPAPFTDPAVVDRVEALLAGVGMSPVRVRREIEGFVYNRLQGALLREAYCLVRDGVADVDDVDRVVREGLGRRWAVIGPFETADLNTRGGIEAHARRLGPAYERMGAERGQHDPWTPELVAHVTAERRRRLPLESWDERVAWRDRVMQAVAAALDDGDDSPGGLASLGAIAQGAILPRGDAQ